MSDDLLITAPIAPIAPIAPVAATAVTAAKTVLHVGCGDPNPDKLHVSYRGPEWREVRLDIDPTVQPDIVASITDMAMVASESVDAVWSSHNLEHLYPHDVPLALGEFCRVIKPAGHLLITLPDLQRIAELVANDKLDDTAYVAPAGPIAPIDMIYGFRTAIARGNFFMAHRTGFTQKTLVRALAVAGFRQVRLQRGKNFDLWAFALKTVPPASNG
ncbi:MAG: methyltransferase domain-containing protein [Alphaproteobacteria bacterium]|nr:methyltransferase domain-containing protein [Alphaproteobacteria bacterium]